MWQMFVWLNHRWIISIMPNFYNILQNTKKLRSSGKPGLFRSLCLMLTGFFLIQLSFPGAAFCLIDGSRVIQCQSLGLMPQTSIADNIPEATCCSRTCKEKPPTEIPHQSSSNKTDEGSCCISIGSDHDGVICLSFSESHVLEPVIFFDPIEPFVLSSSFLLYRATEKPPLLESLRSVVLILWLSLELERQ